MKDMGTDVLHNALSARWVESYDGLTVRTCLADMTNKASVWACMLHHKAGFPWQTLMLCDFNARSAKPYHPVLDMGIDQRV